MSMHPPSYMEWMLLRGALRLLILALLEDSIMQGYQVVKHVESLIGEKPSLSTIYTILSNLEKEGLIKSLKGETKRYMITERGRALLRRIRSESKSRILKLIHRILGIEDGINLQRAL
ncbi:MAG: PadR family transcriptional regulator [Thermoprotei archaeon]|nr:PadR family transcriptional regulator [Thermoprotei archaeon]